MKIKKIDVIFSVESLGRLRGLIKEAERNNGSFLMQVFSTGYGVGLFIPPERCDEVQEFINKLKTEDDEREGNDE